MIESQENSKDAEEDEEEEESEEEESEEEQSQSCAEYNATNRDDVMSGAARSQAATVKTGRTGKGGLTSGAQSMASNVRTGRTKNSRRRQANARTGQANQNMISPSNADVERA